MQDPCAVSSLPVEEGARRLALGYLAAATAARARLSDSSDSEALHDYRVALRRLRSCLRGYRKYVRSTVTRKSVRRLRRLARGTSQSRDLEVHLAWLGEQLASAPEPERAGISWMTERLEQAGGRARERMLARDERVFPRLQESLIGQLTKFRATVRLDTDPRHRSTLGRNGPPSSRRVHQTEEQASSDLRVFERSPDPSCPRRGEEPAIPDRAVRRGSAGWEPGDRAAQVAAERLR